MTDTTRCPELNKEGKPCQSPIMASTGKCSAHSGIAQQNLDPVAGAVASAAVRQARSAERKMSFKDKLARKLDERADEVVDALITQAVTGNIRAINATLDRIYGKPTTVIVDETDTLAQSDLAGVSSQDLARRREELLEQARQRRLAAGLALDA